MSEKHQIHELTTNKRRWEATIEPGKETIDVSVWSSKSGFLGDEGEFQKFLFPLIQPYLADPRPIVIRNRQTGLGMASLRDGREIWSAPPDRYPSN